MKRRRRGGWNDREKKKKIPKVTRGRSLTKATGVALDDKNPTTTTTTSTKTTKKKTAYNIMLF